MPNTNRVRKSVRQLVRSSLPNRSPLRELCKHEFGNTLTNRRIWFDAQKVFPLTALPPREPQQALLGLDDSNVQQTVSKLELRERNLTPTVFAALATVLMRADEQKQMRIPKPG